MTNIVYWPNQESNGKDRKYAHMGLPGIFEHLNQKGCLVADLCLRVVFYLLHTLASIVPGPGLGSTNLPDRRLELVCDDGSRYLLVLVGFAVD
jgi:hypothetical protein